MWRGSATQRWQPCLGIQSVAWPIVLPLVRSRFPAWQHCWSTSEPMTHPPPPTPHPHPHPHCCLLGLVIKSNLSRLLKPSTRPSSTWCNFSLPNCYIVMSAIIPRLVDHVLTKYRVQRVNDGLWELCELSPCLIFNPTYKFFAKCGQPQEQYCSQRDHLHLWGVGVFRLKQAVQQALTPKNLAVLCHWHWRATVVPFTNQFSTCRGDVGPGSTPSSDSLQDWWRE